MYVFIRMFNAAGKDVERERGSLAVDNDPNSLYAYVYARGRAMRVRVNTPEQKHHATYTNTMHVGQLRVRICARQMNKSSRIEHTHCEE